MNYHQLILINLANGLRLLSFDLCEYANALLALGVVLFQTLEQKSKANNISISFHI